MLQSRWTFSSVRHALAPSSHQRGPAQSQSCRMALGATPRTELGIRAEAGPALVAPVGDAAVHDLWRWTLPLRRGDVHHLRLETPPSTPGVEQRGSSGECYQPDCPATEHERAVYQ